MGKRPNKSGYRKGLRKSEEESREPRENKRFSGKRPDRAGFKPKRKFTGKPESEEPFKKPRVDKKSPGKRPSFKKREDEPEPKTIRLNRFISISGVCSRREADELIKDGKIEVNGKTVTEMGFQVGKKDKVKYQGKFLKAEKMQYVLLNKPKGFITTMKDDRDRRTVMSLVEKACEERIYPVGRLDRQTTGLLLFTNDGELAKKLTHPKYEIKKIYQVELNQPMAENHFNAILEGLTLDDGEVRVDDLAVLTDDRKTIGIQIHSGRNRIIRRIFEHLGYTVEKLDRVTFGNLTKKNLGRGKWRFLTEQEVSRL